MVRKIAELAYKDELRRNSKKPEDAYCGNINDQKRIMQNDFPGIDSHHMFCEDLQTETLTRRNWDAITQVEQNGTPVLLLDKFMLLLHKDMKTARNKQMPAEITMARNIYILPSGVPWERCQKAESSHILTRLMDVWFVLTFWYGTVAQIILARRSKIVGFKSVIACYKGNVEKMCKYMHKYIQSLTASGGQ